MAGCSCLFLAKEFKGKKTVTTLSKIFDDYFLPFQLFSLGIFLMVLIPLPDDKILDWSKLKLIADDILEYIENEK